MIEAMKQALEALESCTPADTSTGHVVWPSYDEQAVAQAITDLRTAIEQAEKEEAWKTSDTAYRPDGLPQDFIKHEVDSFDDCLREMYVLFKHCENEMRYAGWDKREADNYMRNDVYEQIKNLLEKNT